jgi:hypothetical protein
MCSLWSKYTLGIHLQLLLVWVIHRNFDTYISIIYKHNFNEYCLCKHNIQNIHRVYMILKSRVWCEFSAWITIWPFLAYFPKIKVGLSNHQSVPPLPTNNF